MWGGYGVYRPMQQEIASDIWIQRHVPGGLNSPLGRALDNYLGGNPNPTPGQRFGAYGGYGANYGYYPMRW